MHPSNSCNAYLLFTAKEMVKRRGECREQLSLNLKFQIHNNFTAIHTIGKFQTHIQHILISRFKVVLINTRQFQTQYNLKIQDNSNHNTIWRYKTIPTTIQFEDTRQYQTDTMYPDTRQFQPQYDSKHSKHNIIPNTILFQTQHNSKHNIIPNTV